MRIKKGNLVKGLALILMVGMLILSNTNVNAEPEYLGFNAGTYSRTGKDYYAPGNYVKETHSHCKGYSPYNFTAYLYQGIKWSPDKLRDTSRIYDGGWNSASSIRNERYYTVFKGTSYGNYTLQSVY